MARSNLMKKGLLVVLIVSGYVVLRMMLLTSRTDPFSHQPGPQYKQLPLVDGNQQPVVKEEPVMRQELREDKGLMIDVPRNLSHSDCQSAYLGTPDMVLARDPSYSDVTCSALLYGRAEDKAVYARAEEFMKKYPVEKVADEHYVTLTEDCKKFKTSLGFYESVASAEEEAFPIAYNILMHKDLHQIVLLLRAIYRPGNQYCIHLDAKQSDALHLATRKVARCFHNVFLATKLERIVYAGFSRLQADINCMSEHLQSTVKWRYLINLAGQSFPLRTNLELVQILTEYNGANDIEGIFGARIHRSRFEVEWKEIEVETSHGKLVKTGAKNPVPPHDIDIVRGSAYGVFSRGFVDFIIHDERAKGLLEWSRHTYSPDEHYWATLHHTYTNPHLHTPGGYSGKPDEKPWLAVFVAWGGADPCHGKWVRGTCVFGVQDLPHLVGTRKELFSNKFYYDYQPLALHCMDQWIKHKTFCRAEAQTEYYRQLPFVKKDGSL